MPLILVVEDSPTQSRQIGLLLEDNGYSVATAMTGGQALMMVNKMSPDLIILDIILPDLDGFTVCRRLRQEMLTYVPVLMLTQRNQIDDKVDGFEVGADDYLTKPFNERELAARVAALLRVKSLLDELNQSVDLNIQRYQILRSLALTDQLTGLYNRHYFFEIFRREFELAQRYNTPLGFLMIDLDLFRDINNTYGHQTGDRVLHGVAQLLQGSLRHGDYIARFGGEEIAAILPNTSLSAACQVAERMRASVAAARWDIAAGKAIGVTCSFGAASMPDIAAYTLEELIERSDQALYRAKQNGRNRVEVPLGPG